jgi:hypothetical protein
VCAHAGDHRRKRRTGRRAVRTTKFHNRCRSRPSLTRQCPLACITLRSIRPPSIQCPCRNRGPPLATRSGPQPTARPDRFTRGVRPCGDVRMAAGVLPPGAHRHSAAVILVGGRVACESQDYLSISYRTVVYGFGSQPISLSDHLLVYPITTVCCWSRLVIHPSRYISLLTVGFANRLSTSESEGSVEPHAPAVSGKEQF